jgi:hypothetical protein
MSKTPPITRKRFVSKSSHFLKLAASQLHRQSKLQAKNGSSAKPAVQTDKNNSAQAQTSTATNATASTSTPRTDTTSMQAGRAPLQRFVNWVDEKWPAYPDGQTQRYLNERNLAPQNTRTTLALMAQGINDVSPALFLTNIHVKALSRLFPKLERFAPEQAARQFWHLTSGGVPYERSHEVFSTQGLMASIPLALATSFTGGATSKAPQAAEAATPEIEAIAAKTVQTVGRSRLLPALRAMARNAAAKVATDLSGDMTTLRSWAVTKLQEIKVGAQLFGGDGLGELQFSSANEVSAAATKSEGLLAKILKPFTMVKAPKNYEPGKLVMASEEPPTEITKYLFYPLQETPKSKSLFQRLIGFAKELWMDPATDFVNKKMEKFSFTKLLNDTGTGAPTKKHIDEFAERLYRADGSSFGYDMSLIEEEERFWLEQVRGVIGQKKSERFIKETTSAAQECLFRAIEYKKSYPLLAHQKFSEAKALMEKFFYQVKIWFP